MARGIIELPVRDELDGPGWLGGSSWLEGSISQSVIWSWLPQMASRSPLGEKRIDLIPCPSRSQTLCGCQVSVSQRIIWLSPQPVAKVVPSGEKSRDRTDELCTVSSANGESDVVS